ncbi:antA/AntB antirepressor family protein [Acinetobacter pittii]|uniref:antA/AntB antirepressor family protein n=1 Tax=Acinetobacter pittii TaxID=48296 RepID=UPI0029549935|nr:antA/AntB antirepressor family protein [Acinetobacter pittii]MDV7706730.1 antA/AntB antirepressor family protein [Acinetobacter pittii]MDV7759778.1 antA/AntB antirepressor family protein [Acinetobacter pittii]
MNMLINQETLIPVVDRDIGGEVQPSVDARELHKWLKSGEMFATWIKKRIKTYKFIENEDYISFLVNPKKPNGGRSSREYILTIDMAKELSMVENNEQGRAARRYFINCEKALRQTAFGLMNQFNRAVLEFEKFTEIASNAGRTLCLVGKQYKPQALNKVEELKQKITPLLPFEEDEMQA